MTEINDNTKTESYDVTDQIKLETSLIRSRLCDYSDAYILVKGNIKITGADVATRQADKRNNSNILHLLQIA